MLLRRFTPVALAALVAFAPLAARAQEEQPLNPKQVEAVRKVVRQYLMEHPEVIAEAIDALREKQIVEAEAAAQKVLTDRKKDIFEDPDTPVIGNAKGDVALVEFFDYRCPYCKQVADPLLDTVKADGKVRLVMKELPILGADSVTAARAALAAREQKKYEEFHRALMAHKGQVNEAAVMKVAADVGLNVERLKKDMEAPAVSAALKRNLELAQALNVNGTPAFIIGDRIVPGAVSAADLKQLIDQQRKPVAPKK